MGTRRGSCPARVVSLIDERACFASSYLKNTIRQTTKVLRNTSVKVNILRFKNLKTNVQLHDLQSRKVIVYPSTRCPVCKDAIYADQVS